MALSIKKQLSYAFSAGLMKLSASLSGISRTRRSEGFVTTPDSSYYRSSGCTISAGQSPCVYGVDANSKNRNSMDVDSTSPWVSIYDVRQKSVKVSHNVGNH